MDQQILVEPKLKLVERRLWPNLGGGDASDALQLFDLALRGWMTADGL